MTREVGRWDAHFRPRTETANEETTTSESEVVICCNAFAYHQGTARASIVGGYGRRFA